MNDPHVHDFYRTISWHRAPVGPHPSHTSFEILVCPCGAFRVWPEQNFDLVTGDFREQFERMTTALHWRRVDSET